MSDYVVETNVAISANNRNTHATKSCSLSCLLMLREITETGRIVVDAMGLVFDEYRKHLNFSGQPGTGDLFFKHLFNHQYNSDRVVRVTITPDDEDKGFAELPTNKFDPSDRKLLACAVVSGAPVVNATDSDWHENQELMTALGVNVVQLCPDHSKKIE